ncbi:MaoC family dehydratase [Aeropyrum camini]|uniref:MaoC family dehydratase n=1 Tax=Aeropyrum camini TaxID=229980 RepID=UPI000B2EC3D9|nr:MaoC family dehydratase [Aeropyrum camini]
MAGPSWAAWGEEGPYFEDFRVGDRFWSWPCKTLRESDNTLWTAVTGDSTPLYVDKEYAGRAGHRDTPIHPVLVLALTASLAVRYTSINSMAFLGAEYMRIHKPVYPGDTLCVETEVAYKRESRSRPDTGIVVWVHRAYSQSGELVAEVKRANLVYRRGRAPRWWPVGEGGGKP